MKKNKKKRWTKKKVSINIKDIIGIIYFLICVGLLAYCFIATPILLSVLKKHGTKTEAVITSTTIGGPRYTTPNYIYEFYVGDKTYEGNSLVDEQDSSKIGTKIVLCTFTLFNADFCTFLQSLRSEQGMNLLCSLVMLIVISIAFLRTVFDDKVSLSEDKRFSLGYGYLIWV